MPRKLFDKPIEWWSDEIVGKAAEDVEKWSDEQVYQFSLDNGLPRDRKVEKALDMTQITLPDN